MSYVCATLAHALRRQGKAVLVFFCGQHAGVDDADGLQGPQGLLRSLVAQLVLVLVQNGWMGEGQEVPVGMPVDGMNMGGWSGEGGGCGYDVMEECEEEPGVSLGDLCGVFYWLLGLVPRETSVVCLVDGMSYYEREYWREDYEIVVGMFGRIVQDPGLGGFLKVLMTSPTVSQGLPEEVPHQRIALRGLRAGGAASERAFRAAVRTRDWME